MGGQYIYIQCMYSEQWLTYIPCGCAGPRDGLHPRLDKVGLCKSFVVLLWMVCNLRLMNYLFLKLSPLGIFRHWWTITETADNWECCISFQVESGKGWVPRWDLIWKTSCCLDTLLASPVLGATLTVGFFPKNRSRSRWHGDNTCD